MHCGFKLENLLTPRWTFEVLNPEGECLGAIRKHWSGLMQEMFTDADNFGVEFPKELPSSSKALLLAAVFLVDFMFFEDNDQNSQSRRGGGRGRRRYR